MLEVIVYSTTVCPFCMRAKQLLDSKDVGYQEVLIDKDLAKRDEMLSKSGGRRTVPQIFINDYHVGGFDDLQEIVRNGKFEQLIKDNS